MQKDLENCLLWRKTVPRGRKLCQLILQQFPHKTWLWEGKKRKSPPFFCHLVELWSLSAALQHSKITHPFIYPSIHPPNSKKWPCTYYTRIGVSRNVNVHVLLSNYVEHILIICHFFLCSPNLSILKTRTRRPKIWVRKWVARNWTSRLDKKIEQLNPTNCYREFDLPIRLFRRLVWVVFKDHLSSHTSVVRTKFSA